MYILYPTTQSDRLSDTRKTALIINTLLIQVINFKFLGVSVSIDKQLRKEAIVLIVQTQNGIILGIIFP